MEEINYLYCLYFSENRREEIHLLHSDRQLHFRVQLMWLSSHTPTRSNEHKLQYRKSEHSVLDCSSSDHTCIILWSLMYSFTANITRFFFRITHRRQPPEGEWLKQSWWRRWLWPISAKAWGNHVSSTRNNTLNKSRLTSSTTFFFKFVPLRGSLLLSAFFNLFPVQCVFKYYFSLFASIE